MIIQRKSTQTTSLSPLLTFISILKSFGFLLLNMFSFLRRAKEPIYACCYTNVYSIHSQKIMFYSQVSILCLKFKILQGVNSVSMIQLGGPGLIPNHYISVRISNEQEALHIHA